MTKIKVNKNANFTVICNKILIDKRISTKTKGLFAIIMSLPDNWDFSIYGISKIIKESQDFIKSAIKELIEFGYCHREQNKLENGKFGAINYCFYDEPQTEKPQTEKPLAEKPQQLNNKIIKETIIKDDVVKENFAETVNDNITLTPIDECKELYLQSEKYQTSREAICISNFLTVDELKGKVKEFILHLQKTNVKAKTMKDFVKHFAFWVAKTSTYELKKEKLPTKQPKNKINWEG